MKIVVDASVSLKWVLPEFGSDEAIALRSTAEMIAPSIWLAEIANGLWKHVVRRELELQEASARLDRLLNAPVTIISPSEDFRKALKFASEFGHPIYDCLYLALAVREDTCVVTADRRFAALGEKHAYLERRVRLLA